MTRGVDFGIGSHRAYAQFEWCFQRTVASGSSLLHDFIAYVREVTMQKNRRFAEGMLYTFTCNDERSFHTCYPLQDISA